MSDKSFMDSVPNELFLKFLSYLATKDIVKCRGVSKRWKDIIDDVISCEIFWRKSCVKDFETVFDVAVQKCRMRMPWSKLYRSLSLWPRLPEAIENQDEFCPASIVTDEICGFTLLRDGVIGVHKRGSIQYYDVETFKTVRQPVIGNYAKYSENNEMIVIHSFYLQLYLIRKERADHTPNVTFHNVKIYILLDHCVYFNDMNDNLHIVVFSDAKLKASLICRCSDSIMAMGYKDGHLQLVSYQRNLYKLVDRKLVFVQLLGPKSNILHELYQCKLLEQLDWRICIQWMYILEQRIPPGPLKDIISMRIYGDVVFVGSSWGVLRIYYQPFIGGEFNLFEAQPMKQYNFMERFDCPVLSSCPILGIDAFEIDNGHLVIVAMPKKIAVLRFTHNFLKIKTSVRFLERQELNDLPQEDESITITIA